MALLAISATLLVENNQIIIKKSVASSLMGGLVLFLILASQNSLIDLKLENQKKRDPTPLLEAAKWIKRERKLSNQDKKDKKRIIFLSRWSDFPVMYFANSNDRYNVGLEPLDLFDYVQVKFWRWFNISQYGVYCDQKRDCREKAEIIENANPEKRREMLKENGKNIIKSIKNDFRASFIVCTSGRLVESLESQPSDQIFREVKFVSEYSRKQRFVFELR